MPAPDWEDLDDFFELDDFATEVAINLESGDTLTLKGIFDDPYYNPELGSYEMDVSQPRLWCKETDVKDVSPSDTVSMGDMDYDILNHPEPDGTGLSLLRLAERND